MKKSIEIWRYCHYTRNQGPWPRRIGINFKPFWIWFRILYSNPRCKHGDTHGTFLCLSFYGLHWTEFHANGPIPEVYGRYIDDCIGVTSMCRNASLIISMIIMHLWNLHGISDNSLECLDVLMTLTPAGISTSVHYKPTDSHSYLHYSSHHPQKCKDGIPFSQFLRLRRLCSEEEDFTAKSLEMVEFFPW